MKPQELARLPGHHAAVARLLGATHYATTKGGSQDGKRFLARWGQQKRGLQEADAHWNAIKAPLVRGAQEVLLEGGGSAWAQGRGIATHSRVKR